MGEGGLDKNATTNFQHDANLMTDEIHSVIKCFIRN